MNFGIFEGGSKTHNVVARVIRASLMPIEHRLLHWAFGGATHASRGILCGLCGEKEKMLLTTQHTDSTALAGDFRCVLCGEA